MASAPPGDVRIAIIDDNVRSIELMSSALAQEGVEILTATDAEEGLDLILERHPHIVLSISSCRN